MCRRLYSMNSSPQIALPLWYNSWHQYIRRGGSDMAASTNGQSTVVRTSRGLSIAGTRITLYALLDYLHADWPPKLVQDWFDLTDKQMDDVLTYLAEHGDEVEREYQQVLQQAEANR